MPAQYGYCRFFLKLWQLWQQTAPAGCQLQFILLQQQPLSRAELANKLRADIDESLLEPLLEQYPAHICNGFHRMNVSSVKLTLIIDTLSDNLSSGLKQLKRSPHPLFNQCNQQVDHWLLGSESIDDELSQLIFDLSKPGAAPSEQLSAEAKPVEPADY